jgi:hypothetical protein
LKILFENPLLSIEEVSIVPVQKTIDIDLERSRRTSEAITAVFAQLQVTPNVGEVLKELDQLIIELDHPLKGSLIQRMKVEYLNTEITLNQTLRSPEYPLMNNFFIDF